MGAKNDVRIMIEGKPYIVSGNESSEYLQKVGVHIENTMEELKKLSSYSRGDAETKRAMLALVFSDEYFKMKEKADSLLTEKENLEKDIFDVKHELISAKNKIEDLTKELEEERKKQVESECKIARLETENKHLGQKNHR